VLQEWDDRIVVARHGAPLLLGLGDDGNYAASDASALLQVTRRMIYLEDGDIAELTPRRRANSRRRRHGGKRAGDRPVHESTLSADDVELGDYTPLHAEGNLRAAAGPGRTLEMIGGAQTLSPNLFGVAAPRCCRREARC
jgi:glucosamine--fructose-6-phosphate aminotransferase (isomerizing)